jgi:ATP-binding cassette subfamily C (CFTR/MRP) protein 4
VTLTPTSPPPRPHRLLQIVNLVSNDVRRFDDAATFWNFLLCGPLELAIVLVLVGLQLGFAAAVAGVSTLLLLIPTQVGGSWGP